MLSDDWRELIEGTQTSVNLYPIFERIFQTLESLHDSKNDQEALQGRVTTGPTVDNQRSVSDTSKVERPFDKELGQLTSFKEPERTPEVVATTNTTEILTHFALLKERVTAHDELFARQKNQQANLETKVRKLTRQLDEITSKASAGSHSEESRQQTVPEETTTDRYLQDQLDDLQGLLFKMQGDMDDLQRKTHGLQRQTNGLQEKTDGLQEQTKGLQEKTDGLQEQTNGLQEKMDNLQEQKNGLQEKMDNLQERKNGPQEKTDVLQEKTDSLQGKKDNLQGTTEDMQGTMDTQQGKVVDLQGNMDYMQGKVDCLQGNMEYMQDKVDGLQGNMEYMQGKVDGLQGNVDYMQGTMDELHGRMEVLMSLTSQSSSGLLDMARQGKNEGHHSHGSPPVAPSAESKKLHLLCDKYKRMQEEVNHLKKQMDVQVGSEKDKGTEWQEILLQLQMDCKHLHKDNRHAQSHIEAMYTMIEDLEKKNDEQMVEIERFRKAHLSSLENRVSQQVDSVTEQLDTRFNELLDKAICQDQKWEKAMDGFSSEMECKLNCAEFDSVMTAQERRLRELDERLQAQEDREHKNAAGFRKKVVENVNCISCDRPLQKEIPEPDSPMPPSSAGFPARESIRPYTAYAMTSVRELCKGVTPGPCRPVLQEAMKKGTPLHLPPIGRKSTSQSEGQLTTSPSNSRSYRTQCTPLPPLPRK